jgi:hypothetical protein
MTFKLEKKNEQSIFDNITCYEKVDKILLLKLYCSSLLKITFNNPFCSKHHKGELEQLGKYYNKINDNGYAEIKYKKTDNMDGWGRVFPENSVGLYSIRRQLRHTLAKNYYVDIDVKQCHAELLLQLCNHKGIEPKYLKYLVNKREKIFDLVYKVYLNHNIHTVNMSKNEKKDIVKNLFIRLMYYGNFDYWLKDYNLIKNEDEDNEDAIKLHAFINSFTKELNKIGKEIISANPQLEKLIAEKKAKRDEELSYNKKGSIVSYYLQEYENQVLECIYKYLVSKKIINQNMPDVVLCADGLMIPKDKYNEELLNELQNEIYNELGFHLCLLDKDMDEDYLDIIDNSIIDKRFYKFYDSVKSDFEKTHFKIMNPILFAEETNSNLILRKRGDFSTAYENINYIDIEFNEKGELKEKQKKFINNWFLDENMRTYNKIDFLPKMTEGYESEKVYNTFNGFNVEKKIIDLSKCDIKFEDTKIYEHIKNLCGNDDKTIDYLIKTLAMKVQKPSKIMGTSIIFKSVEGCGKDSFFNFFGNKILGNRYYLNEDKIDLIFGRFNKLIENKLLVCINETSGSDTFTRMNCIKNAITREVNVIEIKGVDGYENRNCILYIWFTNNEVVMKIDGNERRFICIECDSSIATNKDYFDALFEEFNNDIHAKLFYDYLMNIDLIKFDFIKDRPETNYLKTLKEHSMPIFLKFVEEQYIKHTCKKNGLINKSYDDLYNKFDNYLQNGNIKYETNKIKFGMDMKKYDFIEKIYKEKGAVYVINFIKFKNYMKKNKYELDFVD